MFRKKALSTSLISLSLILGMTACSGTDDIYADDTESPSPAVTETMDAEPTETMEAEPSESESDSAEEEIEIQEATVEEVDDGLEGIIAKNPKTLGEAPKEYKKGGHIDIMVTSNEYSFDPAKSHSMPITIMGLLHRRLNTWQSVDGETKLVPDLAKTTGEVSDGGKTWTFELKEDAKFSDGSPITSKDIKYGVERTFDPALAGGLSYHKDLLEGAEDYEGPYGGDELESIETPDDYTIIFHLNKPYGYFDWLVSLIPFAPVPEGDNPSTYGKKPITSGPYVVVKNDTGKKADLERNEYWSSKSDKVRLAAPDTISFIFGQDPTVTAKKIAASSGKDANAISSYIADTPTRVALARDPKLSERLHFSTPGPLTYLAINTEKIDDIKVREAISLAIDRTAVVHSLGGPIAGKAATTFITPGIKGNDSYEVNVEGDKKKAKELLKDNSVLGELNLITWNSPNNNKIAETVANQLEEVGIDVNIQSLEYPVFMEKATLDDGSGYDLAISSWNPDFPSPLANIEPLFSSSGIGDGGFNLSRLDDKELDEDIVEAISTLDMTKANKMWEGIDKKIADTYSAVPLIYGNNAFIAGSNVNFVLNPYPAYQDYTALSLEK